MEKYIEKKEENNNRQIKSLPKIDLCPQDFNISLQPSSRHKKFVKDQKKFDEIQALKFGEIKQIPQICDNVKIIESTIT